MLDGFRAPAMKKQPSKLDLRNEIEQQVADYLQQGGEVDQVDRGISGRDSTEGPIKPQGSLFNEPRSERTLVPEVVAALEARRRPARPAPRKRANRSKEAKKIPVYDDFGEIVRWVWSDQLPDADQ